MTTWYEYRVYCTTDSRYKTVIGKEDPVVCPSGSSHTLNTGLTTIIEERDKNKVRIEEESVSTGGHFQAVTAKIDAAASTTAGPTTSSVTMTWPYDISVLAVEFVSGTAHQGDCIDLIVGEDTVVGALTAHVPSLTGITGWVSQAYSTSEIVSSGDQYYTCIANCPTGTLVSDTNYWQHGFELNVSSTVVDNTDRGFHLNLLKTAGGLAVNYLDRVIKVDTSNNKVYVETAPTYQFLATSPTYVRQTVYMLKEYIVGEPFRREIGTSKIGGSHVPANTDITIKYTNHEPYAKTLVGEAEFLY